jgi:flagellar biosynthesis GTPase FlhF
MVDGVPEYGTMSQRLAVGLNDYVDPSGRKVVHYTKIMKKHKVSEEQVLAEARKFGQAVDACHFIQPELDSVKRGRPKAEKPVKVSSGVKGRPKKTKKVVEIDGEEDDLFATLVAESINGAVVSEVVSVDAVTEVVVPDVAVSEAVVSEAVSEVSKAPEKANKSEAKAAKEQEKAAKLAAKEQENAAKLAAKEQEKAAKEQEKAAKEQEKAAKLAAKEQEKAAKIAAKSEAKAKPAEKPAKVPANDETSAADVVKKIEFEGKKYLKSKKTGIVYDYEEYVKSGDQVIVGKWNEATNKLDFESAKSEEESEDEYDEEE